MAIENLGKCVTIAASTDLSSSQYCFVKVDTSAQVAVASDGGANAIGVLQDDPAAADRAANVMVGPGITKVKAGAAITAGDNLSCDSSGRATTATSGETILGQALEAATAANQYITALFQPRGNTL